MKKLFLAIGVAFGLMLFTAPGHADNRGTINKARSGPSISIDGKDIQAVLSGEISTPDDRPEPRYHDSPLILAAGPDTNNSNQGTPPFRNASGCPDCSGSPVVLENVTFYSGTTCECVDATSITIGPGVTVQGGATVTFEAPTVELQDDFHAEEGAVISIRQK